MASIYLGLGLFSRIGTPAVARPIQCIAVANKPAGNALAICPAAVPHKAPVAAAACRARRGQELIQGIGSGLPAPVGYAVAIVANLPTFRRAYPIETDALTGNLDSVSIDHRSATSDRFVRFGRASHTDGKRYHALR
ncbi:hypothetical protein ACHMW7_07710 [Aminobacter sp. UC22_36]|uniref:hypothetical protein n=1 Tax=Aminobacter sp. UC22_36 TaxID=3374549 RepID=UPI003757BFB3